MRCHEVQGLFSEIYDGIAENQAILEKHIQECPTCAAEYKDYSQLLNEIRQLPMPELPEDFHKTIMAKVRETVVLEGTTNIIPIQSQRQKAASPSKSQKRISQKAYAATRRWASVAVAASLLLVSMWAVHVFDLGPQVIMDNEIETTAYQMEYAEIYEESTSFYIAPESVTEEEMPAMDRMHIPIAPTDEHLADYDDSSDIQWAEYQHDNYDTELRHGELEPRGIMPIQPTAFEIDIFQDDINLLYDGGQFAPGPGLSRAWAIAFTTVAAVLAISLAGMLWSIYRKKAT